MTGVEVQLEERSISTPVVLVSNQIHFDTSTTDDSSSGNYEVTNCHWQPCIDSWLITFSNNFNFGTLNINPLA